jgi:hypothetical protein
MSVYCKSYYGVPSDIGRRVEYDGKLGIIYKDGGNYIAVNFDSEKPGVCANIHPTDPLLKYLEMGTVRKMTRSQKTYQEFLDADCGFSFGEWIGAKR